MITRRDLLKRTVQGSSLIALSSTVPGFVARAAEDAETDKEKVLVIVELSGGNDGLNTVIPFSDDDYHKARPTLRYTKDEVLKVNDQIGLHPSLYGLSDLLERDRLAIVQGVGYPNPNRSHFESMDIWHTADPNRSIQSGWLGRTTGELAVKQGKIPAFHVGQGELPLAFSGASTGVPTFHPDRPFALQLEGNPDEYRYQEYNNEQLTREQQRGAKKRANLVRELTELGEAEQGGMLNFVRRTSLDTYTTIDRLQEIASRDFEVPEGEYVRKGNNYEYAREGLGFELMLIARMVAANFGTRIYYVSLGGFDTHGDQREGHAELLTQLSNGINSFYAQLDGTGDAERVLLMTFSEFGRRVDENGSKGTDHGAGSCMFLAGPAVKSGPIGEHPSLNSLYRGDLVHHTDFRQVYATVLDRWLECNSRHVLDGAFEHVDALA